MIAASELAGHWVRHWIKAPGWQDHSTRVHWMQAGMDYADVRIPLDRPDLTGARCLADLPCADLALLAGAEGFAGHVTLEGDHCTWHREINWHGAPDAPDVGAISFDDQGRMIEAGVHADYTELWEQHATAVPTVLRASAQRYQGVFVTCGEACVFGLGQVGLASLTPLRVALDAGRIPQDIALLFDGIHGIGHWDGAHLIPHLATNPFAQGHPVVTRSAEGVVWNKLSFDGTRADLALETSNRKESAN